MKKLLFVCIWAVLLLNSCRQKDAVAGIMQLDTQGNEATSPYFSTDNHGNPVLCWTEKSSDDSLSRLKYAVYNQETGSFLPGVTVPGSAGISTSAENMGKVAFKADGTVMAIFSKRFEKEKNPFAGAIYFSSSADQGKTWSEPRFLHSDTSHAYGRSFFDIATLKNGELATIWLDGRYGKTMKGSALFFASTQKGKSFEKDSCIARNTCECCRTDLLTDAAGNLHIAYRGIAFPSPFSDKQVRDMVYSCSADNGKTFSKAKPISNDNWEINGCPHSGPALALTGNQVHAVWFTAGGSTGLYSANAVNQASDFKSRRLITATGKHPQLIALQNGRLVMACEEPTAENTAAPVHQMDHAKDDTKAMGRMKMMHHTPAAAGKIALNILGEDNAWTQRLITDGKQADHHAVLSQAKGQLLLAWIREHHGRSAVCYTSINVEQL